MVERIYCLSDPAEPGLVRIARWCEDDIDPSGAHNAALCRPTEDIDWSVDVDDAAAAIAAIDRSMRWYRKNRGGEVYRCSPKDAWHITIRYSVARRRSMRLSSYSVTDALLTVFLVFSLLSGIVAMQVTEMHSAISLSLTAIILAMLTFCLALVRDLTVKPGAVK